MFYYSCRGISKLSLNKACSIAGLELKHLPNYNHVQFYCPSVWFLNLVPNQAQAAILATYF